MPGIDLSSRRVPADGLACRTVMLREGWRRAGGVWSHWSTLCVVWDDVINSSPVMSLERARAFVPDHSQRVPRAASNGE